VKVRGEMVKSSYFSAAKDIAHSQPKCTIKYLCNVCDIEQMGLFLSSSRFFTGGLHIIIHSPHALRVASVLKYADKGERRGGECLELKGKEKNQKYGGKG